MRSSILDASPRSIGQSQFYLANLPDFQVVNYQNDPNAALPAQCQALWYTAPGQAQILGESIAAPGRDEVRVCALTGALSRGTESLIWSGRVPPAEFDRMRAPFMGGEFPFPVKYGYATVGRVQCGPAELVGKQVFSLTPHQTLFNIATSAVIPLPANVPAERAVLAANMETALNAVWDAMPGPADRIAIVGGGVVGMLVAYLCGHLPGADVTLVDVNADRAPIALSLGLKFATPEQAPLDCDLVVHCSGAPQGLTTALSLAGEEASVIEMSWYGDRVVSVPLGGAFHSRQLRLQSSQVGHISSARRPRWTYQRRLTAALGLLADPRLDVLIAPPVAFKDLPARLPDILGPASRTLCQLIQYV